ncbi:hypothetical protein [Heyndrickxia oleronia]|uniref:hypothetical protein n=1 Tax=Heyndrickxia oleronia TaxID=38875 RepID=UPI00203B0C73|nr:hypothetical protein [Heyndrickxia oleronia]
MVRKFLFLLLIFLIPYIFLTGCNSYSTVHGMDKKDYNQGKKYAQMLKDAMTRNSDEFDKERDNFHKFIDREFTKDDENLYLLIQTLTAMSIFVSEHNIFGGNNGQDGFDEAEKLLKDKLDIELK